MSTVLEPFICNYDGSRLTLSLLLLHYDDRILKFIAEAVLHVDVVPDVNLIRQKSQQPARPP